MIEFTKYQEQKGYARNTIRSNENTVTNFKTWCESEKIEFEKVGYNELLAFVQYCQMHRGHIAFAGATSICQSCTLGHLGTYLPQGTAALSINYYCAAEPASRDQ
jgi:hypothetical protein